MSEQPVQTPGDEAGGKSATAPRSSGKQFRRTMLSTGFSDVPGKTCEICGFQGFRWQTSCPKGHALI